MIRHIWEILTGKKKYSDIWHFFVGNYRYKLYYSTKKWKRRLIRPHILEQIDYRIKWMDQECFFAGQCKMCGCQTTALQMASKACDKPCYPTMMDKKEWHRFITIRTGISDGYWWKVGTDCIKKRKA
jgi:hypothetical protein